MSNEPSFLMPLSNEQAQRASERGAEADILAAEAALSRAQEELADATRDRDALLASCAQACPFLQLLPLLLTAVRIIHAVGDLYPLKCSAPVTSDSVV